MTISWLGSSGCTAMPSKQRSACAGPPASGTMIEAFEDILPGSSAGSMNP